MPPRDRGRQPNRPRPQPQPSRTNVPVGLRTPTLFPLPMETASVAQAGRNTCDNLGLWVDRFTDWEWRNGLQPQMAAKKRETALKIQAARPLVDAYQRRSLAQHAAYQNRGYSVLGFTATPDYRLVVGFGAEHVLETSLCLHRIYGFPIIPGSAVKGVTRAWAFWEIVEKLNVPETSLPLLDRLLTQGKEQEQRQTWEKLMPARDFAEWQTTSRAFYATFGTTERQGRVIFFDAYPMRPPKLKLDILNPHYGPYYPDKGNETPPADYHNPVPNYFLTVIDTAFQFAVASKDPDLANKAKEWLIRALTELGIGGKTAAGYGFMEVRP